MYSYDDYYKVKAEIENRRLTALSEADSRSAALRAQSEELRKIDEELAGTGPLIFKTACTGGDIEPIRKRNRELNERRKKIIISLGYPEDYTDVHYTCKECSDTGYINGTKMCRCLHDALVKQAILSSGIGNLIEKQSFENFDLERYKFDPALYEDMKRIVQAAKRFAKGFRKADYNLLLVGTTGSGKTHLATAIAREVIELGCDVLYDSVQNIMNDFESDHFRSGYTYHEPKGNKYLECDLLIMDDLGAEFVNQFTISALFNLINTRHNKGLKTVITSNLDVEELGRKYDGRILSRIMGNNTQLLYCRSKDSRVYN